MSSWQGRRNRSGLLRGLDTLLCAYVLGLAAALRDGRYLDDGHAPVGPLFLEGPCDRYPCPAGFVLNDHAVRKECPSDTGCTKDLCCVPDARGLEGVGEGAACNCAQFKCDGEGLTRRTKVNAPGDPTGGHCDGTEFVPGRCSTRRCCTEIGLPKLNTTRHVCWTSGHGNIATFSSVTSTRGSVLTTHNMPGYFYVVKQANVAIQARYFPLTKGRPPFVSAIAASGPLLEDHRVVIDRIGVVTCDMTTVWLQSVQTWACDDGAVMLKQSEVPSAVTYALVKERQFSIEASVPGLSITAIPFDTHLDFVVAFDDGFLNPQFIGQCAGILGSGNEYQVPPQEVLFPVTAPGCTQLFSLIEDDADPQPGTSVAQGQLSPQQELADDCRRTLNDDTAFGQAWQDICVQDPEGDANELAVTKNVVKKELELEDPPGTGWVSYGKMKSCNIGGTSSRGFNALSMEDCKFICETTSGCAGMKYSEARSFCFIWGFAQITIVDSQVYECMRYEGSTALEEPAIARHAETCCEMSRLIAMGETGQRWWKSWWAYTNCAELLKKTGTCTFLRFRNIWTPKEGGVDRDCDGPIPEDAVRGAEYKGVDSLYVCKDKCRIAPPCTGVSFNHAQQTCTIWHHKIIGTKPKEGSLCLVFRRAEYKDRQSLSIAQQFLGMEEASQSKVDELALEEAQAQADHYSGKATASGAKSLLGLTSSEDASKPPCVSWRPSTGTRSGLGGDGCDPSSPTNWCWFDVMAEYSLVDFSVHSLEYTGKRFWPCGAPLIPTPGQ